MDSFSTTDDLSDLGSQGQVESSSEGNDVQTVCDIAGSVPKASSANDLLHRHGLAPPPGLAAPAVQSQEPTSTPSFKYWERVISQQPQPRRQPPIAPAKDSFAALKEALNKLAPTEIATVRSMLDSKMHDSGTGCDQPLRSGNPIRSASWRSNQASPQASRAMPASNSRCAKPNDMDSGGGDSLRTFLHELTHIDNSRVLSVRKISKLGYDSGPLLHTYFSEFGAVERVMVAPTTMRQRNRSEANSQRSRTRPACLGFVVMETAADVEAVLKFGEVHTVEGVEIGAFPFQGHDI